MLLASARRHGEGRQKQANRRRKMTKFFNLNDTARSLVGIFAAVLMGGTFLAAAAGPAAVAGNQESNIVRVA
jgi:hypothetical protein